MSKVCVEGIGPTLCEKIIPKVHEGMRPKLGEGLDQG